MKLKKGIAILLIIASISSNTFAVFGIGGGGSGSSTFWQMKTFYETVKVEANTIKQLRTKLEEMRILMEQIRNLPEEVLKRELGKYTGIINDLVQIQNEVKGLLGDARAFETYMKDMYKDVKNLDYIKLLDKYAETVNDLAKKSMEQSVYYSTKAQNSVNQNAIYLKQQARNAQNPVQLLQVLNSWNSNLSLQLTAITDMINNNSRIEALEYLEKANQIKMEQEERKRMLEVLNKRINEMKSKQKK